MKLALIGSGSLARDAAQFFVEKDIHVVHFADSDQQSVAKLKPHQVLRVQKCFLEKDECTASRMQDLFRVVYQIQPEVPTDQAAYQQLSEQTRRNLQHPFEAFEDCDAVVWLEKEPLYLGPAGSPALNELREDIQQRICYRWKEDELEQVKTLAIVGEEFEHNQLEQWLKQDQSRSVFHLFARSEKSQAVQSLEKLMNKELGPVREQFYQEIESWKNLEDYERVKVPRPIEPEGRYSVLAGFSVLAVDALEDQQELFLTCERPSWRGSEGFKTLSLDRILCCRGEAWPEPKWRGLISNEPGFFHLTSLNELDDVLLRLKSFFSLS